MEPFVRAPKTLLSGRGGSQLEGKMEPFCKSAEDIVIGFKSIVGLGAGRQILNSVF
jgi:hypothetical protein